MRCINKIEKEQMKSGNINTRNKEKDIIIDLNVHFFFPCYPDQTYHHLRLLNCANQFIRRT